MLAGERTGDDPVAKVAGTSCKVYARVAGRPMLLRVLDALAQAPSIDRCILCGPQAERLGDLPTLSRAVTRGEIRWVAPRRSPSESTSAALALVDPHTPVLLTAGDHPLLQAHIVEHFCQAARRQGCDVVVALSRFEQVANAYPENARTHHRFRDGRYCGCNLYALMSDRARRVVEHWQRLERHRKRPLRLLATLGWVTLLRHLTGRLTLDQTLALLSSKAGAEIGAVILPYPQAAVDVDSAADLALAERLLLERAAITTSTRRS